MNDARRRLDDDEIIKCMQALRGWSLASGALVKDFEFADFHATMAFVNAVAWIAHRSDHHPDMEVGYRHCRLRFSTHSASGLTALDFAAAAAVDDLLA